MKDWHIIFVSPTDEHIFSGYADCVTMARDNSGCRVSTIMSDRGPREIEFLNKLSNRIPRGRLDDMAIRRHLVALDHIEKNSLKPPFIFPDWDFMIFRNLNAACEFFEGFDFSTSRFSDGNSMPAHLVCNVESLREFYRITMEYCDSLSDHDYASNFHDMMLWRDVARSGKFKVENTLESLDGVFDPGMHHTSDKMPIGFEKEADGYKRIEWKSNAPGFVTVKGECVNGGVWMPANWIHCWGKYKLKTSELRNKFTT